MIKTTIFDWREPSTEVLPECDAIVELPMFGVNKSLNVMVSLGIVLYEVIEKVKNS